MKISIRLSHKSISRAISKLNTASQNLRWGVSDTVDILANNGAEIAQGAYGKMANATNYMRDETTAIIASTGEANLIAEFGAGDATIPGTGFEHSPDTPTYAGSYSELVGSGQYAEYGWWRFGGRVYRKVEPRMGLLEARDYVKESSTKVAKGVIKL